MKIKIIILSLFFSLIPLTANAADISLSTMMANASGSFVELIKLSRAIAWMLALILGGVTLFKMKEAGEGKVRPVTVMLYFTVTGLLLTLPGTISTVAMTLSLADSSSTSLLSRDIASGISPETTMAINSVLLFIKFIGHTAFIRGLLILKDCGEKDGSSLSSKAFVHIAGGVVAINIESAIEILENTFFGGALF